MRVDAIGFVEVVGLVAAVEAADAMVKAAQVRLLKQHTISPGWVTLVVEGDLASCKAAVDAGKAAAARLGQVLSTLVLGRPDRDTEGLVLDQLRHEPEAGALPERAPPRAAKSALQSLKTSVPKVQAENKVPEPIVPAESAHPDVEIQLPVVNEVQVEVQPNTDPLLPEVFDGSEVTAAVHTAEMPKNQATLAMEPPAPESLFAYIAAATRGRTCQEVARRFHLAPAVARELLEQWLVDGRLDKSGSRYLVAQRLI
ncbi:BMC domain-containing protein [Azonexus sp. IMCC34839]|uniref:BMC domain-containing protein n=1 Tax=Azonexus sp. IMCC34839 TaxID=3133695 RepID=UPI0039998EA3